MPTRFSRVRKLQPTPPVCKEVDRPPFFNLPWPGDPIQASVRLAIPVLTPIVHLAVVVTLNRNGPLNQWIYSGPIADDRTLQVRAGWPSSPALWDAQVEIRSGPSPIALAYATNIPTDPTRPLYTVLQTLTVQTHHGWGSIRLLS